ncbi:ImuA family protein [Primorskyibacter sp. 2E233]|uniref:ImuA family protein n=1 Tax=Primorskyibacter sp. 2E233 TaxID=3413431 RepID=UPI003BF07A3C
MSLADPLLGRRPHHPPPALELWDGVRLPYARVHEVCGRARRTLALRLAAKAGGPVFWIAQERGGGALNPDGMVPLIGPGQVTFLAPKSASDLLWCMEEVLRAGCVPTVITELPEPPPMTPVRRLHLAAETGAAQGMCQPLGLILTPGRGGAAGIETRWGLEPAHLPGRDLWRLERMRARMLPPQVWWLEGDSLTKQAPRTTQDAEPPLAPQGTALT